MPLDFKTLAQAILGDLDDNQLNPKLKPTEDQLISGLEQLVEREFLDLSPFPKVTDAVLQAVKAAVEKAQSQSNGVLTIDKLFGVKTLTWLQFAARCAGKLQRNWATDPESNPRKAIPSDVKFDHLQIRYFLVDPLPAVRGGDALTLLHKAWKSWGDVCGVFATQTPLQRTANVLIRVVNIDGPSSILADADVGPPPGDRILELHIDAGEDFDAFKFEATLAHEIGHLLGLDHAQIANQLMGAVLSTFKSPQSDDIERVKLLWGPPAPIQIFAPVDPSDL